MATQEDYVDENIEENILYDLSVQAEWVIENEIFTRLSSAPHVKTGSLIGRTSAALQRTAWTFLRKLGVQLQTPTPCILPEALMKLVNSAINWHIAVSSEGRFVAVLQENCVEIRSHRDFYDVVGKGTLPLDPNPQWRCIAWSPDDSMLACSRSNGTVDVFDIVGTRLFTIDGVLADSETAILDHSSSVVAIIFTTHTQYENGQSELLVINYHGSLKSYLCDRDNGFTLQHSFVFSQYYPLGVSSVIYHPKHKLLLVGGLGVSEHETSSKATQEGITAWRILSDTPHYKLVTDYSEDIYQLEKSSTMWKKLRVYSIYNFSSVTQDGIYKMCLSPDGNVIAAIHHSGKLSLWDAPSLRLRKSWLHNEQPFLDEVNTKEETINRQKRKVMKELVPHKQLLDLNFWSNKAVILSRCTGALTISSIDTLYNLLGPSPEWFSPSLRLSQTMEGELLGLECDYKLPERSILDTSDDFEDSDEEDITAVTKATRYTKQVLHYLTDSERFRPPRKKPIHVTKSYKLISLRSTTPEELYARKIDNEEYGEALVLAKAYGLDCDLVYQRRWRKSPVSVASIQDYLSKISKRSWVLHECLERVPDNIDAMKELLNYGLCGTDLPALIAIGQGEDGGRFILCDPEEGLYEDMSYDEFDPRAEEEREERKQQRIQELLNQVDVKKLNLEQKELCRARLRFLQYLDRLRTYECILGGPVAAPGRFNSDFFKEFRSQNIVELTAGYARNGDCDALHSLFTFHSEDILPHRLAILANFPETLPPEEYKSLLPQISKNGDVEDWVVDSWRNDDWVEEENFRLAVNPNPMDLGSFLYEENSELQSFRVETITSKLLTSWYRFRACEIERLSRQVDCACHLIKLGMERGVQDLDDLLDDLFTMEMLVYECNIPDDISFKSVQEMADYDKLKLILSKSPVVMYTKNVRKWVVPFLKQCERHSAGSYSSLLRRYIVEEAKTDLSLIVKMFQTSGVQESFPVILTQKELMTWALEAIYATERDDQLQEALDIFLCLPSKGYGDNSAEIKELHKQVDQLERQLRVVTILKNHGIQKPVSFVRKTESDAEEAKLLVTKLTRLASNHVPHLSSAKWMNLHEDMLELQDKVYRCIPVSLCHEIFVESLLCSSRKENIKLAGELIEGSSEKANRPSPSKTPRVEYKQAIQLTLSAAREYFNSSTNLMDPCMELARSCLGLIADTPPAIQEELDLIASLALLDDFGVSILPLQVRLHSDRLSLVRDAANTRSNAYKQFDKLLKLGHLLRIKAKDANERDGQVLLLMAEAAIKNKDFTIAYELCQRLLIQDYGPGWTALVDLAEVEEFTNINAKVELLSYALAYCTLDMIEPILQAKCLLETQLLYERIHGTISDHGDGPATSTSLPFTAQTAILQTQQILSSTTKTTKAVLSTVTDTKWWQGAVHSLKQPIQRPQSVQQYDDKNIKFTKQGCHPFYKTVLPNAYTTKTLPSYNHSKYEIDEDQEMSENILRTAKLEEMLTEGEKANPAVEVLLQLARASLPKDSSLGLAYLLALPQPAEAEKCFEEFPSTAVSLQLAVYYYALQVYSHLKPCTESHIYSLYQHNPNDIVKKVVNHVTNYKKADWPQEVVDLIPKLKNYQEMLEDYNQAKSLKDLGKGVDVVRFTDDHQYKHETILGLTMTVEDDVYNLSKTLAKRYDVPLWDVYMSHLEFLFTDSGLKTDELKQQVQKKDILKSLTSQPVEFCKRMYKYVYPCIDGHDHQRLQYFFFLLNNHPTGSLRDMLPEAHMKLLNKIKMPNLDYKELMNDNNKAIDVLRPILTADNINTFARYASSIPIGNGEFLDPSSVYSVWAVKLFWEGDGKTPSGKQIDWLKRFDACKQTVQGMLSSDYLHFIDEITFTKQAKTTLLLDHRKEIIDRAIKFCKQPSKLKDKSCTLTWAEVASSLQYRLSHLDNLNNDTIRSFSQVDDPVYKEYSDLYDLSAGRQDQLEKLFIKMILDGQTPDLVDDVLQVSPLPEFTVQTALQDSVKLIALKLRGEDCDQLEGYDCLKTLEDIVTNVQEHEETDGDLVKSEDVMVLLRPFCSDSNIAVKPRLDVLHILGKSFHLSDEDSVLLNLYRTKAVISEAWSHIQVTEDDVKTEENRLLLFNKLLPDSKTANQYLALCRLLKLWPTQTKYENQGPEINLWVKVFDVICKDKNVDNLTTTILQTICDVIPLNIQCTKRVFDNLVENNKDIEGVKLVLLCQHKQLYTDAVNILTNHEQPISDNDLLNLLLKNHLMSFIVPTLYYPLALDILLDAQGSSDLPDHLSADIVARELKAAGYDAEAGTLLLRARSSHPLLQTFGSALGVVGKWLKS